MEISIQYLAGLFDGEGWISISKTNPQHKNIRAKSPAYQLKVGIAMCDYRPVKSFADFFNGKIRKQVSKETKRKPLYHFYTSYGKANHIIESLEPYLICKKEQAKLALEFYQYCIESKCQGVRGLSRRPIPDFIIKKRHQYYLNLNRLKSEYPQYQP